jgi:actin-related protein
MEQGVGVPAAHGASLQEPPHLRRGNCRVAHITAYTCLIVSHQQQDASVLVLASYGRKTGIVVDVGHEVLSVSPVYEGKLLRSFVRYVRRHG